MEPLVTFDRVSQSLLYTGHLSRQLELPRVAAKHRSFRYWILNYSVQLSLFISDSLPLFKPVVTKEKKCKCFLIKCNVRNKNWGSWLRPNTKTLLSSFFVQLAAECSSSWSGGITLNQILHSLKLNILTNFLAVSYGVISRWFPGNSNGGWNWKRANDVCSFSTLKLTEGAW